MYMDVLFIASFTGRITPFPCEVPVGFHVLAHVFALSPFGSCLVFSVESFFAEYSPSVFFRF